MDFSKQNHLIEKKVSENNREILEIYTYCGLCGSELLYVHTTDYVRLVVEEQSLCPLCNVQSRTRSHPIQ